MTPAATIAVIGPTASGKSDLAVELARRLRGEVVSVDSMQVYRGMDIGTAKPGPALRAEVPHHMLDLCEPEDEFTVAEFQAHGRRVMADLDAVGDAVVIAGGSGLHVRSLVDPLEFPPTDEDLRNELDTAPPDDLVAELLNADPGAARHVDLANPRRVVRAVEVMRLTGATPTQRAGTRVAHAVKAYEPRRPFVGIEMDPGRRLRERAERRFDAMLDAGLLDEVSGLAARFGSTASQAVGYKELLPVVRGEADLAVARGDAIGATMALAKRQRTYFSRDPRIDWLVWDDDPSVRCERALRRIEEEAA